MSSLHHFPMSNDPRDRYGSDVPTEASITAARSAQRQERLTACLQILAGDAVIQLPPDRDQRLAALMATEQMRELIRRWGPDRVCRWALNLSLISLTEGGR